MTAADTWTRRLFLMDRVPAQLDLLPCSAAMPADLGPTSFARWLVIPFSHEPLDPEHAELFDLLLLPSAMDASAVPSQHFDTENFGAVF